QGPEGYFLAMEEMFSKLNTPILYEIGNHESKYSASFEPGYSHESLRNYYEAQMRVNGMDKLLYSFDIGKWHFIVWPDPLRKRFWERHPHYFDWLEKDLESHKNMPTMVFHHVPAHPIGIDPLTEYAESPYVKRTFTDLLGKHGNVKYVISGHVHIPLRASIKTAVEYKGMKFINLPAAGYRPRAFGEEDLYGGPSQGVALVNIKGSDASIDFKNVMNDVYTYPGIFRKFDPEEYPFWYKFRWELPMNDYLKNGNFSEGLTHWKPRYFYIEDREPSNIQEVRVKPENPGERALYLFNKKRGFDTAGQDRLAQTLNRVAQVVKVRPGKQINVSLEYMPEKGNFDIRNRSSFYIWIEGYEKSTKRLNITYSPGYQYFPIERNYSQHSLIDPMRMELPAEAGKWHKLKINPWKDFKETTELEKIFLDKIDRFIINLGVWTINDGYKQNTGVYFSNVDLNETDLGDITPSTSKEKILVKKDNEFMIWGGADHVAGEHITWRSDMNFYGKQD
ncbi:MAG: metallophosphoesterase family protein, partial [Bacteroidales bacterium]